MYNVDKQYQSIVQPREIQLLFCNKFKLSVIYKILNHSAVRLKLI